MENKQTALEWLIEEMLYRLDIRIENTIDGVKLLEQAKAMEKEQIKDVFDEARLTNPILGFKHVTFGQYYNETYGKE